MKAKIDVRCPVCDSTRHGVKYEPWVHVDDPAKLYGAASGIQGTQRLVQCDECGAIYESPRYPDDVILRGYVDSEEGGHDSQYPMRVDSFHRALKSMARLLPPRGARVLDVGTAGGAYLEAAQRFGYHAVGLEPSRFLAEQAQKRGLDVKPGTIDAHPFEAGSFDMVSLWDVIEHLTRPRDALIKIGPLLKPGGILLINYPDIGTLQAKIAGRRFWWILSVHLQHFTRSTISMLCASTGYEVFHFQRYWQTLQFGYLEDMAIHYRIPLAGFMKKMTPQFMQQFPIPYYASQTTCLARVKR